MAILRLSVSCADYDRSRPFIGGAVQAARRYAGGRSSYARRAASLWGA
jgi:hypothetical protein